MATVCINRGNPSLTTSSSSCPSCSSSTSSSSCPSSSSICDHNPNSNSSTNSPSPASTLRRIIMSSSNNSSNSCSSNDQSCSSVDANDSSDGTATTVTSPFQVQQQQLTNNNVQHCRTFSPSSSTSTTSVKQFINKQQSNLIDVLTSSCSSKVITTTSSSSCISSTTTLSFTTTTKSTTTTWKGLSSSVKVAKNPNEHTNNEDVNHIHNHIDKQHQQRRRVSSLYIDAQVDKQHDEGVGEDDDIVIVYSSISAHSAPSTLTNSNTETTSKPPCSLCSKLILSSPPASTSSTSSSILSSSRAAPPPIPMCLCSFTSLKHSLPPAAPPTLPTSSPPSTPPPTSPHLSSSSSLFSSLSLTPSSSHKSSSSTSSSPKSSSSPTNIPDYSTYTISPSPPLIPPLLIRPTDEMSITEKVTNDDEGVSDVGEGGVYSEEVGVDEEEVEPVSFIQLPPSVVISDHSMDEINGGSNGIGGNLDNDEVFSGEIRRDSLTSICSSTSSLSSLGEDDIILESSTTGDSSTLNAVQTSPWRKVRSLVTSPFIQTYKRQKYPWIQLAGHQGNFLAGQMQGTILKKKSGNEDKCFQALMEDDLRDFVPQFKNLVYMNNESYIELEDLLANFTNPSIMDIKMGVRTYLEEELIKAGEKPKLRKDMYEKMVAIDPNEPKAHEHAQRAVTKPRYMVWRESISSSSTLGFRIDGVKLRSGTDNCRTMKDFKRTKTEDSVAASILQFSDNNRECIDKYLAKLQLIRKTLQVSEFFRTHEVIGSSLLLVHDDTHADIWLIDFAKTCPLPENVRVNHRDTWELGNHEDGYLTGLDNLIRIFSNLTCDRVKDVKH